MDCKQKTASISISSALKLIRSSSMFKGFLLESLGVKFLSYRKKEKIAEMETLCLSLSLVVHSLLLVVPFVATRCTTRCHSFAVIVSRCHSLYTRCHLLYHSLPLVVRLAVIRCHSIYSMYYSL